MSEKAGCYPVFNWYNGYTRRFRRWTNDDLEKFIENKDLNSCD